MKDAEVWLVTGCSSGLGREIAIAALTAGHRVVGTVRDLAGAEALTLQFPGQVRLVRMDLAYPHQIESAVASAISAEGRIDVLVNNAGYCYLSAVENGRMEEVRAEFEANFFGALRLTQLVLPVMRTSRRGMIINISSGLGLVGVPGAGFYCAAKFALEGLSESLAHEVAPLGIRVMLVEPGPIRTDFATRSTRAEPDEGPDYAGTASQGKKIMREPAAAQTADPALCAGAILRAATMDYPPFRLPLGAWVIGPAKEKWGRILEEFLAFEDTALSVIVADTNRA